MFVDDKWQGGIYATPTLPGSRSGKDIAGTWAALVYTGMNKYKKLAFGIAKLNREISDVIMNNDNLELLGDCNVMVTAFKSNDKNLNIYDLKDEMTKKDWYLSSLQDPEGIHLCVTAVHVMNNDFIKMFKNDLDECIKNVLNYPPEKRRKSGDAIMYKSNHTFGEKEFVQDLAKYYWDIRVRSKPGN